MEHDPVATFHDDTLGTDEVPICNDRLDKSELSIAIHTICSAYTGGLFVKDCIGCELGLVEAVNRFEPGLELRFCPKHLDLYNDQVLARTPPKRDTMAESEQAKYEKMWNVPEYLNHSPGVYYAESFGEITNCSEGDSLIDLGCGRGEGGKELKKLYNLNVTFVDFVKLDGLTPFIKQPLWDALPSRNPRWKFGYCCDVMEHIPIEYVMLTLERIRAACQFGFFSVSNIPDGCGKLIGEPLHMSVMPYEWWLEKMKEIGGVLDARDLLIESLFYVKMK